MADMFRPANTKEKGIGSTSTLPTQCPDLHKSTMSVAKYICTQAGVCPDLMKVSLCPLIEYSKEEILMRTGKVSEGQYYEWIKTGYNKEAKIDTYSLVVKGVVKKEYKERNVREQDPLELLLER